MFNPAHAAEEIKKELIGYISTSFHFSNQILQKRLIEELGSFVSNGPFIEIKDSFQSGSSIEDLIHAGIVSPLFRDIESEKKTKGYKIRLPLTRPLYLHQEKAISKIVAGRNVVVSTGTGSGKTNCFLIPVINELLREIEAGTLNDGVRAILIYPMNALANDQIKGLREILMLYPKIRFGVYNGSTEHDESAAISLYKRMYERETCPELKNPLPNEVLSRTELKNTPPHILFTNYAMLEHLLLRPGDDVLFSQSEIKYIILDEAHVYAGATGIETAFLMSRLKGRINGANNPQFILTSATLSDGSPASNQEVAEFAKRLTGCPFSQNDIITSFRDNSVKSAETTSLPMSLYSELADESNFMDEVLNKYGINVSYSKDCEAEILYNLLSSSTLYKKMRSMGEIIELRDFIKKLGCTPNEAISFVALCARAQKERKPLVDIRYHYFVRALEGCYMALDYPASFSLFSKKNYTTQDGFAAMVFEIGVCDDCGSIAVVGKINNGYLLRAQEENNYRRFQIVPDSYQPDETDEIAYYLCKNCGAIVPIDEANNKWCACGNLDKVKVIEKINGNCVNCDGNIRRFLLGQDSVTGVIATSLFEQIPEYSFEIEQSTVNTDNPFFTSPTRTKKKTISGSQFLVFSDSRQGAAKFACYLTSAYKQFIRRRGVWAVAEKEGVKYENGLSISDFVRLLENYFSTIRVFRESNAVNANVSSVESKRNAWVAVLDELVNSSRSTSFMSLGKISFDYIGNTPEVVTAIANWKKISEADTKNLLDYLVFEIVRSKALVPDDPTTLNDEDREYLFFTRKQCLITKDKAFDGISNFLPATRKKKDGSVYYPRSNKLDITCNTLHCCESDAVDFLGYFWDYLVSDSNPGKLESIGKGYAIKAGSFVIRLNGNALTWECDKCKSVTQFNIGGKCIKRGCTGNLHRANSVKISDENYYSDLYSKAKVIPLFIKEHTAQLAKTDALKYQQQFVEKEINALSCSTTFEMGVDVGDLETVFLRNFPPLAANYAQRVGRAGRSINAAAFAITYAKRSSHDLNYFNNPLEMINGRIMPPNFILDNEKILRRHVYAVALSLFLYLHPEQYNGNNGEQFIAKKGYKEFISWLVNKPAQLSSIIKSSIGGINSILREKYVDTFNWLDEFCGVNGCFTTLIQEYEGNVEFLQKEYEKAMRAQNAQIALIISNKLSRYKKTDLIDFLVRGNILPKYGFPVDSVELMQNIASRSNRSLNLCRDLAVAIADYAPSSEVVADGGLYTSRYIRKPIVNHQEQNSFDVSYLSNCPNCANLVFSRVPVGTQGKDCPHCGHHLSERNFYESIEPRQGFVAEEDVKPVPMTPQERKYRTEAEYIGDTAANQICKFEYHFSGSIITVESTTNDTLILKTTSDFFVCPSCGYSIADDERSKLGLYTDYSPGVAKISKLKDPHKQHKPVFGKGLCDNTTLIKYGLHSELKTDVAKISFDCPTKDLCTMLSVTYALLNAFSDEMSIERRDISACLSENIINGVMSRTIIIFDAVPGGAGHSRRLVTPTGDALMKTIKRAINTLSSCKCAPSCYRCLRSYDNQKIHDLLDRKKALDFLKKLAPYNNLSTETISHPVQG